MTCASFSFHDVKSITATNNDAVPHLTIEFEGDDWRDRGSLTLFNDDEILNARLIEAINSVVADRKAELAAEAEISAAP